MTPSIKPAQKALIIALATLGLLPATGFSKSKPITTKDLLRDLSPTEPWYKGILTATKTVNFQQATNTSGGTDATTVSKITLGYFTSGDCTGSLAGSGFYTTPDGTSYTISVGNPFGLVAASTWSVGNAKLSIVDMTTINSVAITLKSTNNDVPQSDFSDSSFACVPVACAANACTSDSGTQSFELKTTAAVGDPANGGKIADLAGLIATSADNSTDLQWGGQGTAIGVTAQSNTDGAGNTTAIIAGLGTGTSYAARLCDELSVTGGYTTGWFLPAKDQLATLRTNREAIGDFVNDDYWSSTESSGTPTLFAWYQSFGNGSQNEGGKSNTFRVRCVRVFAPTP